MRKAGILLHISSLPGPYGIGSFGKAAYDFVDFLIRNKQSFWQILPLGPTSYGDSPYQTFSAFANNPYFIDLDLLVKEGLLKKQEITATFANPRAVDYHKLYEERFDVLRHAFKRFDDQDSGYVTFYHDHRTWLDDYALFMAIKGEHDGASWQAWPHALRMREASALKQARERLAEDIGFYRFLQYKAYTQWLALKAYANKNHIEIIGDMPIYVSYDSSDVWANPTLFDLDEKRQPRHVAGVPPDSFSKDGQLWGNPLYDWDTMAKDDFAWWVDRVRASMMLYDWIRIDHFIGFQHYFSIPYRAKTAKEGTWETGPGIRVFEVIKQSLGHVNIIAEDLGVITPDVRKLLKETGFPGMKLLQFAFDSREESDYLPHHYDKHTIVYTGTHDNHTTKSWFKHLSQKDRKYCYDYINHAGDSDPVVSLIKATLLSVSETAIIPMQDYLNLGDEARMNMPSTLGDNWRWRTLKSDFNTVTSRKIKHLTTLYGRANGRDTNTKETNKP